MTGKGQAINIDWTVGLSLFLLTALSSVLAVSQPEAIGLTEKAMDNTLLDISSNLEEETFVEGRRTELHVNSPLDLNRKIPLDRNYYFRGIDSGGSARLSTLSDVDISENSVKTVLEMENSTHRMTYLNGKLSDSGQSTEIETGSDISNSMISVDPGSPGLTSIEINGKELLNSDADFRYTNYSINEDEISASTFGGNLTVFSDTSEFIVEDTGTATLNIQNLTTLYWYADNSTTKLEGSVSKNGDTKGLTVASDYGITFLGDLNANVTKQTGSDTVKVQIDTERLRVMAHDSDYVEGWRRIKTYDKGEIYFGAAEKIEGTTKQKIQELDDTSESEFERKLGLGNLAYNITYGIPGTTDRIAYNIVQDVSDQIDWNRGGFTGTSADRKDNSGTLGIGYRNGTAETELTEGLVGYWRMDRDVSGDGGTVKDFSGLKNDGTHFDGVETGVKGVFGTNSSSYRTERTEVSYNSDLSYTNVTVSLWAYTRECKDYQGYFSRGTDGSEAPGILGDSSCHIELTFVDDKGNRFNNFYDAGIQPGEWQHILLKYNNATREAHLYTDGVQEVSIDVSEALNAGLAEENKVTMFGKEPGTSRYLNGSIDEVMVYNRSLSEDEVQQLYFNGRDGEFEGNYSGNRIGNDEDRNWTRIEINASVPSETDLSAKVELYNEFGNDLGDQLLDVKDGAENYTLNVRESERLQLNFNGTSTKATKSWEIYGFKVYTGSSLQRSIIKRGRNLPTRSTFVRDSKPSFIRNNGSLDTIESRVIIWE